MPVSADTLAVLMSKGLAGEDLLDVVRSIEIDQADARPTTVMSEAAKSGAARRMARYREARKAAGLSPYFSGREVTPSLIERDGPGCIYCGAEATTVDHIVPTSKGGTDDLGNLGLACNPCNGGKAGRTPEEAAMDIMSETAKAAHVRYCSGRTVTGEQGRTQPPSPPPKRYNQTPTSSPTSLRSDDNSRDDPKSILGSVLSAETAADLVAHRKALRAPMTAGAAKGLVSAFRAFGDAEAAARAMMANGWRGFKAEWMASAPARAGPRQSNREMLAALCHADEAPPDALRSDPFDRTAEAARPAEQGRSGFAGRLSFEDHQEPRRAKLVDHGY